MLRRYFRVYKFFQAHFLLYKFLGLLLIICKFSVYEFLIGFSFSKILKLLFKYFCKLCHIAIAYASFKFNLQRCLLSWQDIVYVDQCMSAIKLGCTQHTYIAYIDNPDIGRFTCMEFYFIHFYGRRISFFSLYTITCYSSITAIVLL